VKDVLDHDSTVKEKSTSQIVFRRSPDAKTALPLSTSKHLVKEQKRRRRATPQATELKTYLFACNLFLAKGLFSLFKKGGGAALYLQSCTTVDFRRFRPCTGKRPLWSS